jgi:hypothetical protein
MEAMPRDVGEEDDRYGFSPMAVHVFSVNKSRVTPRDLERELANPFTDTRFAMAGM